MTDFKLLPWFADSYFCLHFTHFDEDLTSRTHFYRSSPTTGVMTTMPCFLTLASRTRSAQPLAEKHSFNMHWTLIRGYLRKVLNGKITKLHISDGVIYFLINKPHGFTVSISIATPPDPRGTQVSGFLGRPIQKLITADIIVHWTSYEIAYIFQERGFIMMKYNIKEIWVWISTCDNWQETILTINMRNKAICTYLKLWQMSKWTSN